MKQMIDVMILNQIIILFSEFHERWFWVCKCIITIFLTVNSIIISETNLKTSISPEITKNKCNKNTNNLSVINENEKSIHKVIKLSQTNLKNNCEKSSMKIDNNINNIEEYKKQESSISARKQKLYKTFNNNNNDDEDSNTNYIVSTNIDIIQNVTKLCILSVNCV